MTTLAKKIDKIASKEWKLTPMQKNVLITVILLLTCGIAYGGWKQVRHKSELDAQKYEAIKMADKAVDFGQVYLNQEGKIISWNNGMTKLLGWKSSEMRGKTLAVLDPKGHDSDALIAIGNPQTKPWIADGSIDLLNKDGKKVLVYMTIQDIVSPTKHNKYRRIVIDNNVTGVPTMREAEADIKREGKEK